MVERSIAVTLPEGAPAPALEHALGGPVPSIILAAWRELAADHVASGAYLAMLTPDLAFHYPYLGDGMAVAVVNPAQYADVIEEGHAGYHLPSVWKKWKVGKNGNRFAVIPFNHETPTGLGGGSTTARRRQAMPAAVYKGARGRPGAFSLANRGRLTGAGDHYKQGKSYEYYRGLGFTGMPEAQGYDWKASKYEGLTRFTAETPGGGHHTEYLTFRTITPDSNGWYIPPQPGFHFAARALDAAMPAIADVLDRAAAADAERALGDVIGELE